MLSNLAFVPYSKGLRFPFDLDRVTDPLMFWEALFPGLPEEAGS